jgi:hypothetical protein
MIFIMMVGPVMPVVMMLVPAAMTFALAGVIKIHPSGEHEHEDGNRSENNQPLWRREVEQSVPRDRWLGHAG